MAVVFAEEQRQQRVVVELEQDGRVGARGHSLVQAGILVAKLRSCMTVPARLFGRHESMRTCTMRPSHAAGPLT